VVDAFYSSAEEIELATEITYEDGRRATIQSTIAIDDVEVTPQTGTRAGLCLTR
jgi:hypothetical protein